MRTIRKAAAFLILLAILLSAFPKVAARAEYDTFAAYVAKYKQFLNDDRWKEGSAWGDGKTPEHGLYKAWGCASLCSDFEYYMYGTYGWKGEPFRKAADIRTGDIVKISDPHWFVILERSGDVLLTLEKHKDVVYVSNDHYRMHDGVLQRFGYYNSSGKWVKNWKKCSFSKGYHYIDIDEQVISVEWGSNGDAVAGETGALLSVRADLTGAAAKDVTDSGVILYDAEGGLIDTYEEGSGFSGTERYIVTRYDLSSGLGVELSPGTTYGCSVYFTIAGERYISPALEFTTAEPAPPPAPLAGDFDGNGIVDSSDAIYLLRYSLFSGDYFTSLRADFDDDGSISSNDAIFLLRHTLFRDDYPIE